MIHRFTDNITVLYDGDAAGIKASLRGIDLLLAEGLNVKVMLLPDGDDPDSFAKKHNASEFQEYIARHETDFIRFKTSILLDDSIDDPIKKASAISDIVKSIAVIPSSITRAVYIKECSASFGLEEKILITEVQKAIDNNAGKERNNKKAEEEPDIAEIPVSAKDLSNQNQRSTKIGHDEQLKYERDVIRYIAKYGMCDFCEAVDANGIKYQATALEYIYMELSGEEMAFSIPAYQKIYDKSLSLLPIFKQELPEKISELDALKAEIIKSGINEIRNTCENVDDIQREENSLNEQVAKDIASKIVGFKSSFIEKKLSSDSDDEIRKSILNLVTEKHQLSKLHTKYAKIETEFDRLNELIPNALGNWKNAILDIQIEALLSEIGKTANESRTIELMVQLNELKSLQSKFAKLLGERVIIP